MNLFHRYQTLLTKIVYVIPFLLWTYAYRTFYAFGQVRLIVDAHICFFYTNYYMNHITRGVYPMWNPFNIWGRPDEFGMRMIGEFNPFLYVIPLLQLIGVSFTLSYFIYLIMYFFVGVIGFYLLAQRIFKDKLLAYVAMLLLIFSNVGGLLFNDILIILILVPLIWFFYFLVSFFQCYEKKFLVGLTFTTMIILTTYLPFYFLTVFLSFLIFYVFIYMKDAYQHILKFILFVRDNIVIFSICIFSIVCAAMPGFLWWRAGKTGESFVAWRQANTDQLGLDLRTINLSGFIGPNMIENIFANHEFLTINQFFVPIFMIVILAVSLIVPVSRRKILMLAVSLFVFFISLADATPIHSFLFEHVFFFRLFRNLHFFPWLIWPFIILFSVDQLRGILTMSQFTGRKWLFSVLYIGIILCGIFLFLMGRMDVIGTTLITVVLSMVLLPLLIKYKNRLPKYVVAGGFLILVCIQPMEVFYHIRNTTGDVRFEYSEHPHTKVESIPQFSFTRPKKEEEINDKDTKGFGDIRDRSGFVEWNQFDFGLNGAHKLQEEIDHDVLAEYVQYKFLLFDKVEPVNPKNINFKKIERSMRWKKNVAYVETLDPMELPLLDADNGQAQFEIIRENTDQFIVKEFDMNYIRIKTHFTVDKFLVYNDGFHSEWQLKINGAREKLFRTNIAFKGIYLPAGENIVDLRYRSFSRLIFVCFLYILFFGFFIYLICAFVRGLRTKP